MFLVFLFRLFMFCFVFFQIYIFCFRLMFLYFFNVFVNARQQEISVVQQRSLWYKIIIIKDKKRKEGIAQ